MHNGVKDIIIETKSRLTDLVDQSILNKIFGLKLIDFQQHLFFYTTEKSHQKSHLIHIKFAFAKLNYIKKDID